MTTTININKLTLFAHHGVLEQERLIGNSYEVSLSLRYPCEKAMQTDCLADTLNYAEVVDIVKEEMSKPSQLLEHVVWRIYRAVTQRFPQIAGGSITLAKVTPPIAAQMQNVEFICQW